MPQKKAKQAMRVLSVKERGDEHGVLLRAGVSIRGGGWLIGIRGLLGHLRRCLESVGVAQSDPGGAMPLAGCDPTTVILGPPIQRAGGCLRPKPLDVEGESQGGHGNDTNYCVNC